MKSITLLAAGTALSLLALGGVAVAQTAPATDATTVKLPDSPLKTKKTIQSKALFSVFNSKENKFAPFFDVMITVDGPTKYRIDANQLGSKVVSKPSFYFSDGVKQYEFNGVASKNGIYNIADAPKEGQRPMSQLAAMAGLNLFLNPGAGPRATITRVVTEEAVDGKKTVVVTDKDPARKTTEGKESVSFIRTWFDTATGLPLRQIEGWSLDGVEHNNLQIEYKSWTFDKPITPKTFAWVKPEGAQTAEESRPKLLANGSAAPDFTAYTPEGKAVKLSEYKGKVVVLDFWATWCGPCQQSMPHLEKVYKQVKDKDVVVLAVCVWDEKDAYDKWLVAKKGVYSFPTLFDKAGRGGNDIAKSKYNVSGIPTQYVIDKEGKIAASTIGYTAGQTFLEDTLAKYGVSVPKEAVASR